MKCSIDRYSIWVPVIQSQQPRRRHLSKGTPYASPCIILKGRLSYRCSGCDVVAFQLASKQSLRVVEPIRDMPDWRGIVDSDQLTTFHV